MISMISFAIVLLILLITLVSEMIAQSINSDQDQVKNWAAYKSSAYNPVRNATVDNLLSKVSGIYLNKSKVKNTRLEKTVLINVIETTDKDANNKYSHYLKNLLCFAKHYEYETVVYIIEPNNTRFQIESKELSTFNKHIHTLEYPYELFWKLISEKPNAMIKGWGRGDYLGSHPTFKHFGALVMLVPILEALLLGYNVIFFDVDVALVRDPLPYMISGTADFIVSPEMKVCTFPSLVPTFDWNTIEPNTGIMHVRATPAGIRHFTHWLQRLVYENTLNDQKVVNLSREPNAIRVDNCDTNNIKTTPSNQLQLSQQSLHSQASSSTNTFKKDASNRDSSNINSISNNSSSSTNNSTAESSSSFKYCYLNEFIFQNGLMEFYCRIGKRGSSTSAYSLGMKMKGIDNRYHQQHSYRGSSSSGGGLIGHARNYNDSPNANSRKNVRDKHQLVTNALNNSTNSTLLTTAEWNTEQLVYTPATLHVNFCVTKKIGLDDRGLWLYRNKTDKCQIYNVQKTHYAQMNWTEKIKTAELELQQATQNMTNGDVVKFPKYGTVYLYENNSLHLIPDKQTFIARGFDFDKVNVMKGAIYWLLPFGKTLDSVADVSSKS